MRIFLNDIYPVKKYVLQISVGYKRKEDSSMEEMQTKEKRSYMIRRYTKKPMNLQKRNMEPRKESVGIRISRTGGGSQDSEKRRL